MLGYCYPHEFVAEYLRYYVNDSAVKFDYYIFTKGGFMKNNKYISIQVLNVVVVTVLLFVSGSLFFSIDSNFFSWVAFHERDFSRATDFLAGFGLSYLGPEVTGGGFLPGPFLTLLYAIPIAIDPSPRSIFIFLQLSYLALAGLSFYAVKKVAGSMSAYLSLACIVTSQHYVFYTFSAWHTSFIPVIIGMVLFLYVLIEDKTPSFLFFIGFLVGIGFQIHGSTFLVFIILLVLLFFSNRSLFIKTVKYSTLGFLVSLSYYLYMDMLNGFSNSELLLSAIFNQPRRIGVDILYVYWDGFIKHILYAPNIFSFKEITLISANLLLVSGAVIVAFKKKELMFPLLFLLVLVLFPLIISRHEPRFYVLTHPFYEILIAVSFVQLVQLISKRVFGYLIVLLAAIGLLLLGQPLSKEDTKNATIYFRPYQKMEFIVEVLLDELKLSPEDYRNKFYLYKGAKIWLFDADYVLPSYSHYKLQFESDAKRVQKILNLEGRGVILVDKKDQNSIYLEHLHITKTIELKDFVAYVYEGPYFYKSIPQYVQKSKIEDDLFNYGERSLKVFSETETQLVVSKMVEIKNAGKKPLKYAALVSLNETEAGIVGSIEVISPFLRQSQFAEQAPYYIKNPAFRIIFNKRDSYYIPLMEKHFYKNQKIAKGWDNFYKKHGRIADGNNLGSLYIEAPYGKSLTINDAHLADIKSIVFTSDGYGAMDTESYHSKQQIFLYQKGYP